MTKAFYEPIYQTWVWAIPRGQIAMNERDSFLGEASFGKEGSFVGSNPSGHVEIL
jgi:hypothetical protein